jgi:sulfhydrogenase subunit beta (sulfur reductase)
MIWMVEDPEILADFLRSQAALYGPVPDGESRLVFRELGSGESPDLSRRTDISARNLFQSMTHYFLHFDIAPCACPDYMDFAQEKRIITGLRPCDVASLQVYDTVFSGSESYRKTREATVIIGLLCKSRESSCFCEAAGGAPGERSGMDLVQYFDVNGALYLESLTEKGAALMEGTALPGCDTIPEPFLVPPREDAVIPDDIGKLMADADDSLWEEIGFPCVKCRICTYVCPTCHCFTMTDEVFAHTGARATVWDSCQSREFTLEASGHNPRETGRSRVRQRLMHKFSWYPSLAGGALMCSGCGRCTASCPAGRSLLEDLFLLAGEVR